MENKQLSLEDKVKPYLILAKALQAQIVGIKKVNPDYDVLDKEKLISLTLNQMLLQVKYKDLDIEKYYDSDFMREIGFNLPQFEELDNEITSTIRLPISNLIDTLRINTLEKVKQELENGRKNNV